MKNRKKILFLNTGWSNKARTSANTICLKRILEEITQEYDCTVLTNDYLDSESYKIIRENGITIHHVPTVEKIKFKKIKQKIKQKILGGDIKKRYQYYLDYLHSEKFDYIISISNSFENIKLGEKIKKNFIESNWYIYQIDAYAFLISKETLNSKIKKNIKKINEKKAFSISQKIFLTNELFKEYKNNEYKIFDGKFVELGLPILNNFNHLYKFNNEDKKIKFIFAGTFYEDIRNPSILLEVFSELIKKDKNVQLHLYSNGCNNLIKRYVEIFPENIFIHGHKKNEEILTLLGEADFLVNLGNLVENQLPSKVFEYMSIGKPIINFAQIKNDSTLEYLKYYDCFFNISCYEIDIKKSAEEMLEFSRVNKNNQVIFAKLNPNLLDFSVKSVSEKLKCFL